MGKWRMLDLFSGIGGFSLAASWVWGEDLEIVAFCEIDPFCQKVLHKHWPGVKIIPDIKELTIEKVMADTTGIGCQPIGIETGIREEKETFNRQFDRGPHEETTRIDLLTGGFPCQPASVAGKRKGKADDRWLWPEMFRVIRAFKPTWVIAENVYGLLTLESGVVFEHCCLDLESEGYEVQPFIIPACAVNAPHRRDRVWIVAYDGIRKSVELSGSIGKCGDGISNRRQDVADTDSGRCTPIIDDGSGTEAHRRRQNNTEQGDSNVPDATDNELARGRQTRPGRTESSNGNWWSVEPDVGRVAHGVPNRVDRLKSLGNAIVPQVAAVIMQAIKEAERG